MYTFDSRVRYSETDEEGRLTVTGIINYMQDCSTFQSEDARVGVEYLDTGHRACKENGNAYQPEEKTVKKTAVAWLGCLPCSSGSCCGYYFIRFLNIRR